MARLASLPMYARAELDGANAALWQAIRVALQGHRINAPELLDPDGFGYAFWEDPNLVLSQTCGYPFRTKLADKVGFIGTPDYGLPDCPSGHYYSVFVVNRPSGLRSLAEMSGARLAFNARDSQSGFVGPLHHADQRGVSLAPFLETGGHWASAKAVAEKQADIAAIDAITWRHMTVFDSFTDDLHIIDQTNPVPGLPLITGQRAHVQAIRQAVTSAFVGLPEVAQQLGIVGISDLTEDDYTADRFA